MKGEYIWEQGKDGVKEVRCGNNGPLIFAEVYMDDETLIQVFNFDYIKLSAPIKPILKPQTPGLVA